MSLVDLVKASPTVVEQFPNIYSLLEYKPSTAVRVHTAGALSAGDGGGADWVYLLGNQSSLVSAFPRLFLAPTSAPSGISGCWALNVGAAVNAVAYGLGLSTNKVLNREVLKQLNDWNLGRRKILLPAATIHMDSLILNYNPNWEGAFGATASADGGTGTAFLFSDVDAGDCIKITPLNPAGRITGLHVHNVSIIGKDFFDAGVGVFTPRTQRTGLTFQRIGGQVDIQNTFVIGLQQAYRMDELWDGSGHGMRALYCGAPDGSVPAVWIGSTFNDNSNNMKFYGMHLEFCPYGIYVGLVREVHWYGFKHESQRQDDATHWGVNISIGALECSFHDPMFVTTHTTLQPLVLNQGIRCIIDGASFVTRTPDATSKYPGVIWYLGNRSSADTANVLSRAKFTFPIPSDGTSIYPIQLGNYEQASDIKVAIPATITYAGGTISNVNTGLVSMGYGGVLRGLNVNANTNTKVAGALVRFVGTGNTARGVTVNEGTSVFKLFDGDANNSADTQYRSFAGSNQAVPDVRGRSLYVAGATSPLSITGFEAMNGQEFNVYLSSGSITLVHGPNLLLKSGANTVLSGGVVYKFVCVNSGNRCVQV